MLDSAGFRLSVVPVSQPYTVNCVQKERRRTGVARKRCASKVSKPVVEEQEHDVTQALG